MALLPGTKLRVSANNWLSTATVMPPVLTSEAAGYPSTNALQPQRPFLPWRTTSASTYQQFAVDFGSAKKVELVAAVGLNYNSTITFFFSDDSSFSTGITTVGPLTMGYNIWSSGFRRATLVGAPGVGITNRYMLYRITANAAYAYFDTGGIWAGDLVPLDRDIRWGETRERIEPVLDIAPPHRGWRQRVEMGPPYTVIHAAPLAVAQSGERGVLSNELNQWLTLNHYMTGGRFACWFSNVTPGGDDVWIVRRVNDPSWTINQVTSEETLDLEEATGP
jgi:hypothetical protein